MSIPVGLPFKWIFALCWSSIVAWVWMTIRILKDPYSTNRSFDEYFYQDREDICCNGIVLRLLVLFAQEHITKLRGRFESEP
ncbi:MAG TPA: hypothetical protein VNN22_22830 [Verrucomicrobiae bacterium]|nr:hypothetical protein [Verrucomicrobiae bacterium]